MVKVDMKKLKQLEKDLKLFKRSALPFATKAALNKTAFTARKFAQFNIRRNFTLRNKFSESSVRVNMARSNRIEDQVASTGSIAEYMKTQELGGSKVKKGKVGIPIPTSYSAGEGEKKIPRTRLPRKANSLLSIKLKQQTYKGKSRSQRNMVAIKSASKAGRKFVYLETQHKKGLFKLLGKGKKLRVRMVYDLTEGRVGIHAKPWLKPASIMAEKKSPEFYQNALIFQMKRHNILGY